MALRRSEIRRTPSRGGLGDPMSRASRSRGRSPSHSTWERAIEEFLASKQAEAPVGEAWIRRMRWELRRFPRLVADDARGPPPRSPREVSELHLRILRGRVRWEKATLALHFAALRQFVRWAELPLAARPGPWRLPSGQPSHRRWLTGEQLATLFAAARGSEKVLIGLEGLNGLRRVEVLRLRRNDVLLDEGCLRVLGKGRDGGKWRKIPLHPVLVPLLTRFVGPLAEGERLVARSASGADAILQRAVRRSAVGVRVSHHDLRRTFGRAAHAAGMDLVQLKNLLGHSSVEMTVHYIGLDAEEMRRGLERLRLPEPRDDRAVPLRPAPAPQ